MTIEGTAGEGTAGSLAWTDPPDTVTVQAALACDKGEPLRITAVRPLTEADLMLVGRSRSGRLFNLVAHALDLLLEPEAAENTIGNLRELYGRRRAVKPRYAVCWLFFQVGWVLYGRAMDIYGRFTRARAGK